MKSILLNMRAYNPKAAEQLEVTLEALRKVATAGRNVVREELFGWESDGHASLHKLEDAIRFLPDWIMEESG